MSFMRGLPSPRWMRMLIQVQFFLGILSIKEDFFKKQKICDLYKFDIHQE